MRFKEGIAQVRQQERERLAAHETDPGALRAEMTRMSEALEAGREALYESDDAGVIEQVHMPQDGEIAFAAEARLTLRALREKAEGAEKKIVEYALDIADTLARPSIKDRFTRHVDAQGRFADSQMSEEEAFRRYAEDPLSLSRSQWERIILGRSRGEAEVDLIHRLARAFVDQNRVGLNRVSTVVQHLEAMTQFASSLAPEQPLAKADLARYAAAARTMLEKRFTAEAYDPLSFADKERAMEDLDALVKEALRAIVRAYGGES